MIIFHSKKEIPIGTILRKDLYEFNGTVKDFDGNSHECEAVMIMKEETKENFLKQFYDKGVKVTKSTLEMCEEEGARFYLVSMD